MSQLKSVQDQLLSGVSSAHIPDGFVAEQVLPTVKSAQDTGLLAKYGNSHIRLELNFKAGRGEYRRVEPISRASAGFVIKGHGLEGLVTKADYRNVVDPFKAEEDEVMGLTTALAVEKEYLLAASMGNTSVLTQNTTLSGTSQLSDYTNSNPISVFSAARSAVRGGCGKAPDTAVMDWAVWDKLRYHPAILDALGFKQNRPGGLKEEELVTALGVERVIIANASYNSAKEGQTDVFAPIWGKNIVFGVMPTKAVPYQISLGYLVAPDDNTPRKVYKYAVNNPPSTGILCEDNYDMLFSNVNAGYLVKNAIA